MRLYSATFELSGVFMVWADSYDEATTRVGEGLIGLTEIDPDVKVEVHAISFNPTFEVDD